MFWADRTYRVAGVVLLLFVVLNVTGLFLEADAGNPLSRTDTATMLQEIDAHPAMFAIGTALEVVNDTLALAAVAVALFAVFGARNRLLALFAAAGLLAGSVAFAAADAATMTLGLLAADFVRAGGPGSIAAGDPVILETARAVAAYHAMGDLVAYMPIGLGLLALGALLGTAPAVEAHPPRWLGALAAASGVLIVAHAVILGAETAGIALFMAGYIAALVVLVALGVWLLRRPAAEATSGAGMRLASGVADD